MASKGKGKVPKIDPALQGSFDSEKALVKQQLTEKEREFFAKLAPETAEVMGPTTLCTDHVPNEERPLECAKCGIPLTPLITRERLGSTFDSFLEAEGIKDEVDKRASAAADDGPLPFDDEDSHLAGMRASDHPLIKPLVSKTLVLDPVAVDIRRLWFDRLITMANADGVTDAEFLERLIKRQWISSGAGKGER